MSLDEKNEKKFLSVVVWLTNKLIYQRYITKNNAADRNRIH